MQFNIRTILLPGI